MTQSTAGRIGHPTTAAKLISVVVALHNEEGIIEQFFDCIEEVFRKLPFDVEFICVNDGSSDATLSRLLDRQIRNRAICVIDLTRNFGKEAAMTAGLRYAHGDAVILIDADLQDPPELIVRFVEHWLQGYEVVYGVRSSRRSDSLAKRATAKAFYALFNRLSDCPIPANAGDFRLLDRKVVAALIELPERNRFMKGLYSWVGFKQIGIEFVRQPRFAGTSSWSYWRLTNYAVTALTSFSTTPLRIAGMMGTLISVTGMAYAVYLVLRTLIDGIDVPGYASVMVAVLSLGGIQLLGIGIVGEYVGRLYLEAKGRPIYLVAQVYDSMQHPAAIAMTGTDRLVRTRITN